MRKIFKKEYIRKTVDVQWVLIYVLLAFMLGMLTIGSFISLYNGFKNINKNEPMLSPVVTESIGVKPVYAAEKETVSCETPKGYLECQVYKKVITWAEYDKLYKIIQCESSWNPEAINKNKNGTYDLGLFQINTIHSKKISRLDSLNYKKNIDFGIALYKKQGVRPWVCARILKIK